MTSSDTPETAATPPVSETPAPEAAPAPAPAAEGAAPPAEAKPEEPAKPEVEFPEDAKKGRVAVWNAGNKQGEIRPELPADIDPKLAETAGLNVKFHIKQVANASPEPKEGDKVAFKAPEPGKSVKGKPIPATASEVWVINRSPVRATQKMVSEFAGKVRGRPDWSESQMQGDRRGGRGGRGGPGGGRGGPGGGRGGPGGGGGRGGPGGGRGGPGGGGFGGGGGRGGPGGGGFGGGGGRGGPGGGRGGRGGPGGGRGPRGPGGPGGKGGPTPSSGLPPIEGDEGSPS